MSTTFILNGKETTSYASDNTTLLEVLRGEMRLTGVKKGCETGENINQREIWAAHDD